MATKRLKPSSARSDDFSFLDNMDGLGGPSDDSADIVLPGDKPDPYKDVKYTGKAENDTKAQLNAVQQSFSDRQKKEAKRFELATDTEFWFCVCFETREQKAEFLMKSALGDGDERYVSGFKLAKKMGVKLDSPRAQFSTNRDDSMWADNLDLID